MRALPKAFYYSSLNRSGEPPRHEEPKLGWLAHAVTYSRVQLRIHSEFHMQQSPC